MSDFGDYASAYFGDETLAETEAMKNVTVAESYKGTITGESQDVYAGSSLLLKSNTIVRHYFTEKVTEEAVAKGELYYIDTVGIPAHKLGENTVTTVEVNGETLQISYSPLSYAYRALGDDIDDDELKNVMRAMYLYYEAAMAYQAVTAE